MARAWVTAVPPGVHQAPQGEVAATPERIKGWWQKHQRMKALGIRVPVPWGHHADALPVEPGAASLSRAAAMAKFNAGYLEDSRVGPGGEFDVLLDVPGAEVDADGNLVTEEVHPDGVRRKTAIKEVSAGIRDWTDGQRRLWKDAVVHCSLVTHPVVMGQKGFTPADLAAAPPGGLAYLSTASLLYTLGDRTMADEAAVAEAEPTPAEIASDEAGKGQKDEKVLSILSNLARLGYPLPEDTDGGNLIERLDVALGMAVHQKEVAEADAAAEKAAAGAANGAPVTEESRPVMMSTLSKDLDPKIRKVLERDQKNRRNELAAKIKKLEGKGMPVAEANKYRASLTTYTLSVDEEFSPVDSSVDRELKVWEKALANIPPDQQALSTLTEQPNPAREAAGSPDKEREDLLAEARKQAARVSVPRPKR